MDRPHAPHDPFPIAPRHEAVVDGAHVTLAWEPSPDTATYAVEVAEDPEFHRVLFTQEVPSDVTALALADAFLEDDRTLYWRVSAGNAHGWSEGERIESFISGTAAQVGRFPDPDAQEPFGPVAALLNAATLEAGAEVTPGRQAAAERVLGPNPEGVEAAELVTVELGLAMAVGLVTAVVAIVLLLFMC